MFHPGINKAQELNVTAEWLAFLLSIRDIPGSNLSPKTGSPEVFVVLLSPFRQILG
jgi:hypothetical protein